MLERQRKRLAKRYAAEFFAMVKADAKGALDDVSMPTIYLKKMLPFTFDEDESGKIYLWPKNRKDRLYLKHRAKTKIPVTYRTGKTYNGGKSIDIYGYTRQSPSVLRETIRHEMLHAMLAQAGMDSADDSLLFHLLSAIYHAGAYAPISKKDPQLRDIMDKLYAGVNSEHRAPAGP